VLFAFLGYALFRWLLVRENSARRKILEKWSPEEVERELMYGRGPHVSSRRALYEILATARPGTRGLPLIALLSKWLGTADELGEVRRGDEKITFSYGL
jgi:hypothetical protein